MGQSTDAMLFYGFTLGTDAELPWGYGYDEDEDEDDDSLQYEDYDSWESDCVGKTAVSHDIHCSNKYPIEFLSTIQYTAFRGDEIRIDGLPDPTPDETADLHRIASQLGIEKPDIGWWLVSYWG